MANVTSKFCGKCGSPLENGICPKCNSQKTSERVSEAQTADTSGEEKKLPQQPQTTPAPQKSGAVNAPKSVSADVNTAKAPVSAKRKEQASAGKKNNKPKKKPGALLWVLLAFIVILVLLILHVTKVINIPFLNVDTFMKLDNDKITTEATDSTVAADATAEPDETDMPVTLSEFTVDEVDVREFYEENGTVVSEEKASTSGSVFTEQKIAEELKKRGFVDGVFSEYSNDGEYTGTNKVLSNSTSAHPTYFTYYTSENGESWGIQVTANQIIAIPVTYLSEYGEDHEIIVAAEDYLSCYDSGTDTFFKVEPDEDAVLMIKVDEVNAETLDELTIWEIMDYDR